MRRFALIIAATIAAAGIFSSPASAGKGWCRSDPIISLNDVQIQFVVSIPVESQADVIGPIDVALIAPRSVNMTLDYTDEGFNGYGEAVSLYGNGDRVADDGSFNVTARISVPMRGNQYIAMLVEVIPESGDSVQAQGYTAGVRLTTQVIGATVATASVNQATIATSSSVTNSSKQSLMSSDALNARVP